MNSGQLAARHALEDVLSKAALAEGRLGLLDVQLEPPRDREQVLRRELLTARQQQGVRLPELPVGRGELGQLRSEIGSRMKLRVRKMAPDRRRAS